MNCGDYIRLYTSGVMAMNHLSLRVGTLRAISDVGIAINVLWVKAVTLGLIGLVGLLGTGGVVAEPKTVSSGVTLDLSLALKVGKKVYFARKQGCATCHGVSGSGGKRAGAADLRYPDGWKSKVIAERVNADTAGKIDAEEVAIGLITEGAERWNADFYRTGERSKLEKKMFFDEEMIGIHSAAMKRSAKSVLRLLRRSKVKVNRNELPTLMAKAVYCYLSHEIFNDQSATKQKHCAP